MLSRILKIWSRIEMTLIGLLMFAALGVFLWGAAMRAFAPMHSVDWAEEVALYCIIWATVIAGSTLVAEGRHISTEVFLTRMSRSRRHIIGIGTTIVATGFAFAMMIYGWQAFEFALLLDERSASSLRTPQAYAVFLALPVGMALILARIAVMLLLGQRPFEGEGAMSLDGDH
jgi:TRAP-type C4-dicarboxylate transport system permease small subunit